MSGCALCPFRCPCPVSIVGAGRAAPGVVGRSDREKPLIHDSIHGQKYVQKGFLGKVRLGRGGEEGGWGGGGEG
eukprot:COSAG02_NODE_38592_length_427_cov_0.945122_1_plen_74_part_10